MTEALALVLAFGFGCSYNWLISFWGKSKYGDGFTAVWVVVGVCATLFISSLVSVPSPRLSFYWLGEPMILTNQQHAALYELGFFIAAGLPMFLGSLWRYSATIPSLPQDEEK